MTAEIAILNKGAVTLATDSAVTLTVRGAQKIYNCADKLFELSDHDPMGIMVFNNLGFMGVQLDVAIKQFRSGKGNVHYASVLEASEAFFRYLEDDLLPSADLQRQHAKAILNPLVSSVLREFRSASALEWEKRKGRSDFAAILASIVERRVAGLELRPVAACFSGFGEHDVAGFYEETIADLIAQGFAGLPLMIEHKIALRRLCILTLTRDEFSALLTGIVFAGFGKDEIFPSLVAYEIDGIIFNKLKKRETRRVVTNRLKIAGEIIPFAQREMVDRFLYGIDPDFEGGIEGYLKSAIQSAGEAIVKELPRLKSATRVRVRKSIDGAVDTAVAVWCEEMLPAAKDRFMREVRDMIYLMPKQELATLAQELINLTSVKRKFSSGEDSVGGPIDVAVISKTDGFVWVRRKHYFERDLNPRYFFRKFGLQAQVGDLS